MCGINGFYQHNQSKNKSELSEIIEKMNHLIIHRGPDEDGVFYTDRLGMGMRRLSIIDLSSGQQPIFNADKSLVIVFNGELYNFKEIREDLIALGYEFTTLSDTEVILKAYEAYSFDALKKFDGMFAFSIYNTITEELIIARDRAGEKPLYYYHDQDKFIFGSEVRSLMGINEIPKELSIKALQQYFQLTHIPAPLSIYKNVFKLGGGEYMIVRPGKEPDIHKYWEVTYDKQVALMDYTSIKKKLRELLYESVERRMIADVPLGAFLSGGIDSTIMVAIMAELSDKPIETFTIGFEEKEFDESNRAKIVSDHYGTNHHLNVINYKNTYDVVNEILDNMDEPNADSSAIPTYMVSKFARGSVKTVITGDSGDELFAGYNKYMIDYYSNRYNNVPKPLRDGVIKKFIYALPDTSGFTRKTKKVIENASYSKYDRHVRLMSLGFKGNQLDQLLVNYEDTDSLGFVEPLFNNQLGLDELNSALYTDFIVGLEGLMLAKVDRMSMLNSLETRVPFLSKDVIDFAFSIPGKYKMHGNQKKIILKDTFDDLIPKKLQNAPKKGFAVPVESWMRNDMKLELQELLSEELIKKQNLFNYQFIQVLLNDHLSLKSNNEGALWALYVFQKWYLKNF